MSGLCPETRTLSPSRDGATPLRPSEVPESGAARPFVTLSRQAGAGAISLARAVVDAFDGEDDRNLFSDWQVFDHNLADVVRTEPSIARSLDSLLDEEYRSPTADFFHQLVRSTSDQDRTLARVFQAVRSLAVIGKTIIIARAGSRVAADLPLGLHLRLPARPLLIRPRLPPARSRQRE